MLYRLYFEYGGLTCKPEGSFGGGESVEEFCDNTKESNLTPEEWNYYTFYETAKKVDSYKGYKFSVDAVVVSPTKRYLLD